MVMEKEIIIGIVIVVCLVIYYIKRKKDKDMPIGLQIFNKDGGITLDYTQNTYTIYGDVHTNCQDGSVVDDRIVEGETFIFPYWLDLPERSGNDVNLNYVPFPVFTIENGKISWKYYPDSASPGYMDVKFVYGGV